MGRAEEEAAALLKDEFATQRAALELELQFFTDAALFAAQVAAIMPLACELLGSKMASDAREAVHTIETAYRFGIEGASDGVRRAMVLVWSKEESTKNALVEAYARLYVAERSPKEVARNLVQLSSGCNLGELTSLEELIGMGQLEELIESQTEELGVLRMYVQEEMWAVIADLDTPEVKLD